MTTYDQRVCAWEQHITAGLHNPKLPSIEAAKQYVDTLWAQHAKWYSPRYQTSPSVELATGDKLLAMQRADQIAWAGIGHKGHRIVLRPEGMYPLDCIHEIAHLLSTDLRHEQRFVAVLTDILETHYDDFDPQYARDSAPGYGVHMRPFGYASGRAADAHLLVHSRYQSRIQR